MREEKKPKGQCFVLNRSRSATDLKRRDEESKPYVREQGWKPDANPRSVTRTDLVPKDQPQVCRVRQARRGTLCDPEGDSGEIRASTVPVSPNSSKGEKVTESDGLQEPFMNLIDDYKMGFDELEVIDGIEEYIEKEIASIGQDITDLKFGYEELAREAETLQRRCMELSQENYAMKRNIKAESLINPDPRHLNVGSTPFYYNRGRGQGFRGASNRGRMSTHGRSSQFHRSWSPDCKEGGNNTTTQWRPNTPPAESKQVEAPIPAKVHDPHATVRTP